jgi:predicted Zn-dependent protease with MMP-like domain
MTLPEFEALAEKAWTEIPVDFKAGIDGLVIEKDAHWHPEHEDIFTLGECVTESYPSDFGGPDTIRSAVVLYYGSFHEIAADDVEFDWEHEIRETLQHELQHHLEHLADEDGLGDLDYAVEQNYHRLEGEPFDPFFYQAGEAIGDRRFRVEDDVFVEMRARTHDAVSYPLDWLGVRYAVAIPASDVDVLFVVLEEMPEVRGDLCIVRIRRKGVMGTLRAALASTGFSVEEVFVTAQKL